jgi:hypothetical protein
LFDPSAEEDEVGAVMEGAGQEKHALVGAGVHALEDGGGFRHGGEGKLKCADLD